jgi:hypothetical protein
VEGREGLVERAREAVRNGAVNHNLLTRLADTVEAQEACLRRSLNWEVYDERLTERAEKAEAQAELAHQALHRCRADYHAKVLALQQQLGELREALREALVIAAPAWGDNSTETELFGDIASICEAALGESLTEASAALADEETAYPPGEAMKALKLALADEESEAPDAYGSK